MNFFEPNIELRNQEQLLKDSESKVNAFFRLVESINTMKNTRLYAIVDDFSWSECPMNSTEIQKLSVMIKNAEFLLKKAREERDQIKLDLKAKRKEVSDEYRR